MDDFLIMRGKNFAIRWIEQMSRIEKIKHTLNHSKFDLLHKSFYEKFGVKILSSFLPIEGIKQVRIDLVSFTEEQTEYIRTWLIGYDAALNAVYECTRQFTVSKIKY